MEHSLIPPRLLCFSHLRWGFVRQRPQHLLTRFTQDFSVFFVEEPDFVDQESAELRVVRDSDVTILTPLLPANLKLPWGFNSRTNPLIRQLLADAFTEPASVRDVLWFYTPMSLGCAPETFDAAVVVYDAMDELAKFRGAPKTLLEREDQLIEQADLVFTGGPSLFRARQDRHPRVFCFPSGVDARHFAPAPPRAAAPEAASWGSPVLGFYGVLDERVDFALIAQIADLRPDWTIVMIGPLAKIAREDLPQRANIVYLGKRDYRDLPAYLDRFDVAILPFALNEATEFISPTKTLEYLAAGKPVVSTPIRDVIDLYGEAVAIASTPGEFVECAESMLPGVNRERMVAGARLVHEHGWDRTARRMLALMNGARRALAEPDDAFSLAR